MGAKNYNRKKFFKWKGNYLFSTDGKILRHVGIAVNSLGHAHQN